MRDTPQSAGPHPPGAPRDKAGWPGIGGEEHRKEGSMEFSVPYNGDINLISRLAELREHNGSRIRELFLSGPQEHAASGRIAHNGNARQFEEAVKLMHEAGFRVNLVMNSTCEGIREYSDQYAGYMRDYIGFMVEELGIEAFTVANPYILAMVRDIAPGAEISASVLADVDCPERARAFARLGANVVTPEVCVNRDLKALQAIKAEGLELKVMVNEGCLHKCPYRKFHFNAMSHISDNAARLGRGLTLEQFKAQVDVVAGQTFFNLCGADIQADHSLILKSGWIRPEDLHAYESVATFFKISGRTCPTHVVLRMVRAYMEQSWDGDLLDIMDSSLRTQSTRFGASLDNRKLGEAHFIDHVLNCNRNCAECGFCDRLASEAVAYGELTELKRCDREFFAN